MRQETDYDCYATCVSYLTGIPKRVLPQSEVGTSVREMKTALQSHGWAIVRQRYNHDLLCRWLSEGKKVMGCVKEGEGEYHCVAIVSVGGVIQVMDPDVGTLSPFNSEGLINIECLLYLR